MFISVVLDLSPKLHQHNQGLAAPWLLQRVPSYVLAEDVLFSVERQASETLDVIHVISPRQILSRALGLVKYTKAAKAELNYRSKL